VLPSEWRRENLAQTALRLVDDAKLRARMGCKARQLLEQTFSVQHAVDCIFAHRHERGLIAARQSALVASINAPTQPHELAEQS
jgi:hypothetical protein